MDEYTKQFTYSIKANLVKFCIFQVNPGSDVRAKRHESNVRILFLSCFPSDIIKILEILFLKLPGGSVNGFLILNCP